jgi:release factor glutamine methyltransferase
MLIANVKYLSLLMTIQEARKQLQDKLTRIYSKTEAENITEWVIEHVTGTSRSDRILNKNPGLSELQTEFLKETEKRLLTHEPVQYVLGEAWFCGMKFYVDKNVLIPRPETEELVEWIISNLKFPIDKLKILDIGSGSGCIPVALKRKLRKAEVWSCDISTEALKVATRNAETLGADINFRQVDFLNREERKKLPVFDIIVSNPPYVPEKDKGQMNPNVLDYEPHTALFVPDKDPLIFYRAIADFGEQHLNTTGSIFLEIHEESGDAVKKLFESEYFCSVEIKKDMQGKERMVYAKRR